LNIDAATEAGSVCLARDGVSLQAEINTTQKDHARVIAPFIRDLLERCDVPKERIEAVAITGGPGSYTGLRVATSTAKGLCYAWGVPLIAIGTLEMMASGMKTILTSPYRPLSMSRGKTPDRRRLLYCPMIDARRMDVFTALYNADLQPLVPPAAVTLKEDFLERYRESDVVLFGTGSAKAEDLVAGGPRWYSHPFICHASYLAPLAEQAFQQGKFQDLAYFEPFYLKSFYSPPPKGGL
jgi:tRNA threonylcarbamoyladenosine biosynthesis protein TsaB